MLDWHELAGGKFVVVGPLTIPVYGLILFIWHGVASGRFIEVNPSTVSAYWETILWNVLAVGEFKGNGPFSTPLGGKGTKAVPTRFSKTGCVCGDPFKLVPGASM